MQMQIVDLFGKRIDVTDYLAALKECQCMVELSTQAEKGNPLVQKIAEDGKAVPVKDYHQHNLEQLLAIELPRPDWLFIGTYTTCYVYCDTRSESNGDYKEIARVFFRPVSVQLLSNRRVKYKEAITLAEQQAERLRQKAAKGEQIQVSGSGQTILPTV